MSNPSAEPAPSEAGATAPPAAPYGSPQAPPPSAVAEPAKKKPFSARVWFWILAVIAVIVIVSVAGGGSEEESATLDDPAVEGTTETADAPEDEAEEPADVENPADAARPGIGESATSGDYQVTVTSIETGVPSVGDEYLSVDAQGQFTLVRVDVANISDSPSYFSSSNLTVFDADGREFAADDEAAIYLGDANSLFEEINPGNTVTGAVVFDLPEGVAPQTLEFSGGLFDEPIVFALG